MVLEALWKGLYTMRSWRGSTGVKSSADYAACAQAVTSIQVLYIPSDVIGCYRSTLDATWSEAIAIPATHSIHCVRTVGRPYGQSHTGKIHRATGSTATCPVRKDSNFYSGSSGSTCNKQIKIRKLCRHSCPNRQRAHCPLRCFSLQCHRQPITGQVSSKYRKGSRYISRRWRRRCQPRGHHECAICLPWSTGQNGW